METIITRFQHSPYSHYQYVIDGTVISSIESGKGIFSLSLTFNPYTLNIVQNDLLILNSLNSFCYNINIGDLIAILGSIDFVLGSVDL